MYNKVELPNGFVGLEKEITNLWTARNVIKKNFDMNQDGEYFTFYDGPPTANGRPHVGHVLTRVMKDIIPRYKVMKGYKVIRKAGWDTHGLPVELEIEKKLGISGKEQIEEYGVEKFVKECKESVFTYVSMWEKMTNQIGYWVDMENPYVTYHNSYIESVWWALKQMWDKGLLYEGHKVMPYCPRCGTALSSHEVAQGYKDVKDLTCVAKFKVEGEDNKYILAWTTTPWTLPSNLALCINKAYTYIEAKVGDEILILAKDLADKVLGEDYEIAREFPGTQLLGTKYEQLMPFGKVEGKAFEVIHGDYVTLSDGTGVVHIAPAYGEDDSLVAKANGITFINLVDREGKFVEEVTPWAGKFVKKCDESICKWLEENNKLFKSERYLHSYPHCWRCDTPLLYYPKESWFVAMTTLRDKLLENNNKINWYPDNIRTGRFGKFLENVIDCWFDSGSMPFAQLHYPFENKELFEQNYPAQFISEAVDQTRGWFYTLLAISTAIFDRNPFENCIVLGHVLDKKGLKMSKSKGNVVDPFDVLDAQGADATRWHFYTASAPWLPTRFSIDDVGEAGRKFMGTLWNVYSFYVLYAELDQFNPLQYADFVSENVMDKWIMSKLNTLVKDVEAMLDSYQITQAALDIEEFTDELSNWYVRRNRGRYWTQDLTDDKIGAYVTLYKVLTTVIKVAAPFVPFITENIYQNLVVGLDENAPESIHLCRWPEVDEKAIDKDLEKEMDLAYTIVKLGRSARNGANIKNRQPLSNMLVSTDSLPGYYGDIITDELNIKEVEFGADLSTHVNFEIKPNLPVLGKKYGKLIPVIRKEIAARNQMELAQTIQNGEVVVINVDGNEIELNNENLLVTMQGLEGYAFAGEGSIGVVLDTNITDELREEGHVREMISKIQNMRKDKGFEVADKIKLYVADNDMLLTVIKKYAEVIKKETLTQEIVYNTEADYSDTVINGENLKMTVEVVR